MEKVRERRYMEASSLTARLFCSYETLLCLSTIITEEERFARAFLYNRCQQRSFRLRDHQLARLESFLLNNNAENVEVSVRGPYTLAYPIKKYRPVFSPVLRQESVRQGTRKESMRCSLTQQSGMWLKTFSIFYRIRKWILRTLSCATKRLLCRTPHVRCKASFSVVMMRVAFEV